MALCSMRGGGGAARHAAPAPPLRSSSWRRALWPRMAPHTMTARSHAQQQQRQLLLLPNRILAPQQRSAAAQAAAAGAAAAAAAGATAPSPPQPAHSAPAAAAANSDSSCDFPWTRAWWPVHNVTLMDERRPHAVTVLGQEYVAWRDQAAQAWRVARDRCPHRLAPMSEGRLTEAGELACSYHGWRFDGSGRCTAIPQIGDAAAAAAAAAAPRACLQTFPTRVQGDLLFVWLESGPEAEAEAAATPIVVPNNVDAAPGTFFMSEVPIDWPVWLEQGMDPSHGPFLHHGLSGLSMARAVPMPAEPLPPARVSVRSGFTWVHGVYLATQAGMRGVRTFVPPHVFGTDYDRGFLGPTAIFATPVKPGLTRVFAKFTFRKPPAGVAGALFRLAGRLPHWLFTGSLLQDEDTVVNARQAALMAAAGDGWRGYFSPSRADVGVRAAREWFERAGYERMWDARMGREAAAAARAEAARDKPLETLLSLWDRHTKHCAVCLRGLRAMRRVAAAARFVGAALAIAAVCVAATVARSGAAAATGTAAAAACAVGACVAVWLAARIDRGAYERFINSAPRWRRIGGLSLVKGMPAAAADAGAPPTGSVVG